MGMFFTVNYEAPCWRCGTMVTGFQSKDGSAPYGQVEPHEVRCFYSGCPKCKAWNEYRVVVKDYEVVLDRESSERQTEPSERAKREFPERLAERIARQAARKKR